MGDYPLKIRDYTVIKVTLGDALFHNLYASASSSTDMKVFNIPPFFGKTYLHTFFSSFGPVAMFEYDTEKRCVSVSFKLESSLSAILSTPMTVSYSLPLQKATFNQILSSSKQSWLKDAESLKNESEEVLRQYFREKLINGEEDDDESDSGEWTMVKPKKRRLR